MNKRSGMYSTPKEAISSLLLACCLSIPFWGLIILVVWLVNTYVGGG